MPAHFQWKLPVWVLAVNTDADSQETHTDPCSFKMETLCIIDPISQEGPSLTFALSDTFSKKTPIINYHILLHGDTVDKILHRLQSVLNPF